MIVNNEVYTLTQTVFNVETRERRDSQRELLRKRLEVLLRSEQMDEIVEAVNQFSAEKNLDAIYLIETCSYECINEIEFIDKNTMESRKSYFFVIPICITGFSEKIRIPGFKELEEALKNILLNRRLISDDFELYLSPRVISSETVSKFNLNSWYLVHEDAVYNYKKRSERSIFSRYTSHRTEKMTPRVFFITGVLMTSKTGDSEFVRPTIFMGNNVVSKEEVDAFVGEINEYLLDKNRSYQNKRDNLKEDVLRVIGLEPLGLITMEAYQRNLEMEISIFVDKNKSKETEFVLIPIDGYDKIALYSMNTETQEMVDMMMVDNIAVSKEYNIGYIIDDQISETGNSVILGKKPIPIHTAYEYQSFVMGDYIKDSDIERFVPDDETFDDFDL